MAADAQAEQPHLSERIERSLPESCVEYCIFLIDVEAQNDPRRQLSRLEELRKTSLQLVARLTSDYIWQRGSLNLELVTEQGLAYLRGVSDYGDAIEDEWLIVYILRELSRSHPAAWIRVSDSDGEFLLVEAANVLPKWLSPENDQHRVWINGGRLRIIPFDPEATTRSKQLTLEEAVATIKRRADTLVHSEFIEAEAFYRLEKYPDQIQKSMHHSLVTIPRRLAHVLHEAPKAVAPAVESFYLRDALDLKALLTEQEALRFPPHDLVTLSVKFTRVLFAQLRSQRFDPPAPWTDAMQKAQGGDHARLEMGMKLSSGFEIMLNNVDKVDSREAREAGIVVQDLEEDGDSVLPKDDEIRTWKDALREDDESWMDINYEDFERELEGRQSGARNGPSAGFGDASTQADLRKIVSRFEAFLNDESAGLDGAEVDDMDMDDDDEDGDEEIEDDDDEDKEVSFDEMEFSRMMREMMGLAPVDSGAASKAPAPAKQATTRQKEESDDETDDEELLKLAAQLEAELNEHGALKLDAPRGKTPAAVKGKETAHANSSRGDNTRTDSDDDECEDEKVDIDYNLAKNLLESFKGQAGLPGPAGNILGMMGLQLPRDEDEGETDGGKRN